jgi:glutamate/tyrosine decarboxylase-like PLP-dependent enzyme
MDQIVRPAEEGLDPDSWVEAERLGHRVVEDAIHHLRTIRERPAWQAMPEAVRAAFETAAPRDPTPLDEVYRAVTERVMPYPMGNIHPRFWAWYMGSANLTGALGDFLAAVQGSNLGGGDHAAVLVERQVVNWLKEMIGFPADASGTLVSGGSVANLLALNVARNVKAGIDVRELGVAAIERPLRFYASDQVHSCHRKSVEALGLGNRALRRIASDAGFRIDLAALRAAIAEDRACGFAPACIIASAGTVNTGAFDDLEALADLAAEEGLWLHVDGCIGALIAIAPENRWRVAGIGRADSVALVNPEYLASQPRGLAAAEWLYDYGLQTSRGFRALKVWMALKEQGVAKFGRLIDQNIAQGRYLADLIAGEPLLELAAPVGINIVCFRYRPRAMDDAALKALNVEIMLRLQEQGIAVLSDTTVRGRHCLRVAISNHRTRRADLDLLVREILRLGREIDAER